MKVGYKPKEALEALEVDEVKGVVLKYKDELGKFIEHMQNTKVTDAMEQHNIYDYHNSALQDSLAYGRFLDEYLRYREGQMGQAGSGIMTTIEDLWERFKILFGSITSGNKNPALINEFREIIYYLYKNKHISKLQYKSLMLVE